MRYALFAGEDYYPSGGWGDHIVTCETVEAAKTRRPRNNVNWAHIVDLSTGERILAWDDSVRGWWPPDVLDEKMGAAWARAMKRRRESGAGLGIGMASMGMASFSLAMPMAPAVATCSVALGLPEVVVATSGELGL